MGLMDPRTATEGGGIFDDADGTVTSAKWGMYNYQGKQAPGPGLIINVEHETDGKVQTEEQFWSCGQAKDWLPSRDGKDISSPTGKSGFVKSSNVMALMKSLIAAGFPEDKLAASNDPSVLVGLSAHWDRVAAEKIRDQDKERTVLQVSRIIKLPWESAPRAGGGNGAAAVDPGTASKAQGYIMAVLLEKGTAVKKSDLAMAVFQKATLAGDAGAAQYMNLLADDTFVSQVGLGWTYAGGMVTKA